MYDTILRRYSRLGIAVIKASTEKINTATAKQITKENGTTMIKSNGVAKSNGIRLKFNIFSLENNIYKNIEIKTIIQAITPIAKNHLGKKLRILFGIPSTDQIILSPSNCTLSHNRDLSFSAPPSSSTITTAPEIN